MKAAFEYENDRTKAAFRYAEAFSRNLGWVTEDEQAILRSKRIAIAGMGGVGGQHLLTLTRLGIGGFKIADLDEYELANFNRQAGANLDTIDQPKVEVMEAMALAINPELEITTFTAGVSRDNLDDFLDDIDLYVDGLDFFALDIRKVVFEACDERGIPVVTAAPLGMGTAVLNFIPGGMSFEDYFRFGGHSESEQGLRFMMGLSPSLLQLGYLVDQTRADFNAKKGPSTPMACEICAGVAASQALKILLNRGKVVAAPRGLHFDAYRNKMKITWRPGGNRNPLQQLGLMIARQFVLENRRSPVVDSASTVPDTVIDRVLDLARWAPSGDNTQVWQFERLSDERFVIHAHDTRSWCVYDLEGRASQISVGALMETVSIAASGEGLEAAFTVRPGTAEEQQIDVALQASDRKPDNLLAYVRSRTTQRRPFSTRSIPPEVRRKLEGAVGEGFTLRWLESPGERWKVAKLLYHSAWIRLTTEEGYRVHRETIDWGKKFSEDRIPETAVGVDWLTLRIMKWALQSWNRVKLLNRVAAGTVLPRLQMDLLPGYCCGAHFMIVADRPLDAEADYHAGGRALQRFWLTAARLNLQFQPEMTPLIFSGYADRSLEFTQNPLALERATAVSESLKQNFGADCVTRGVYMGRVGYGKTPTSRSLRKSLAELTMRESTVHPVETVAESGHGQE
jgi:molybdopterin/thiamine biosynthesis adenylyltransferase